MGVLMRSRLVLVSYVSLLLWLVPSPASGQAEVIATPSEPRWLSRWSPLEPSADLQREPLLEALRLPSLLTHPSPRIGHFWSAGNPGALESEIVNKTAAFSAETGIVSGDYRRPLDPGSSSQLRGSGYGWSRLGDRGAGFGQIVVDRMDFDDGVFSNVLSPYGTEPYAILDTLGEATSGTAVLLEGAGGWKVGRLGFGIGLGYTSREVRTVASAVPRIHTIATPGVSGGVRVDLGRNGLALGVFSRWRQDAESIRIYSIAAASRVYEIAGYDEPVRRDLTSDWYLRRFERTAWSHGVTLGGETAGVYWTLFASRDRNSASNFSVRSGDGEPDRWDASGWDVGAVIQATLQDRRVFLNLETRYTTLAGESERPDLQGVPFAADEGRFSMTGEVRLFADGGWEAVAVFGATYEERRRSDGLAEVFSDLRTWRPMAGGEVVRWFGSKLAISVGGAFVEHNPSGTVPQASMLGDAYRNWIAPELALEASEAHAGAGAVTLRWQLRSATAFWLQGRQFTSTPAEFAPVSLQLRPEGSRTGWTVAAGVVLGKR